MSQTDFWAFWLGVTAAVLTVGGAALGLVACYFSVLAGRASGERTAALELRVAEQQERAANAEKDAAEAKVLAAKADEGTLKALVEVARANERAAELTKPTFADDLAKVLADAGWKPYVTQIGLTRPTYGLQYSVNTDSPAAAAISKVLGSLPTAVVAPRAPAQLAGVAARIFVGLRPPP